MFSYPLPSSASEPAAPAAAPAPSYGGGDTAAATAPAAPEAPEPAAPQPAAAPSYNAGKFSLSCFLESF